MKGSRKVFLLFLALVLPGLVFVFLKFFGKNEFNVEPLFVKEAPVSLGECMPVKLPYIVPDSITRQFISTKDSLALIYFEMNGGVPASQWKRVQNKYENEAIHFVTLTDTRESVRKIMTCSFLLQEPFNGVLVDKKGLIRGQYDLGNREDVDRLLIEMAIILRKYD